MDHKKTVEVINQLTGRSVSVSAMYEKINTWRDWLNGEIDGFYEYTMSVDLVSNRTAKMKRHRTDMFKRACEDWASLLLNELTVFELDNKASGEWLQGDDGNGGILGDNDFRRNANELMMVSRWAGTAALEAYVEGGTVVADSGQLLSGKDIGINYLSGDQIIPISHRNGIIKEVAFVSEKSIGDGKKNYDVSMHLLENELYTISYFTIDKDGKVIGEPVVVRTGSPVPWFSVIRKAGYNRYDPAGPFGCGILDGNEDILKGLDTAIDNFIVEMLYNISHRHMRPSPISIRRSMCKHGGDLQVSSSHTQSFFASLPSSLNPFGQFFLRKISILCYHRRRMDPGMSG